MQIRPILTILLVIFCLVSCQAWHGQHKRLPSGQSLLAHPELSEQEKLIPCASCHKEVTPEIYAQWYKSRHGLDNVKCFQCHGTYENFQVEPSVGRCASCHAKEVRHSPRDKKCWACHPAHKFSVHR